MNDISNPLVPFMAAFEGQEIRIVDENGDYWFVAKDVCDILELTNHRQATQNLDDDERGSLIVTTFGGPQKVTVISVPGLLKLVGRSNQPIARELCRYIRHVILPEIIRTGSYNPTGKTPRLSGQLTARDMVALHKNHGKQKAMVLAASDPAEREEAYQLFSQTCAMLGVPCQPLSYYLPAPQEPIYDLRPFWSDVEDLQVLGHEVNHATNKELIALHMPTLIPLLCEHCADYHFDMALRTALKNSDDPAFLVQKTVRSHLNDKTLSCWVFSRTPL